MFAYLGYTLYNALRLAPHYKLPEKEVSEFLPDWADSWLAELDMSEGATENDALRAKANRAFATFGAIVPEDPSGS